MNGEDRTNDDRADDVRPFVVALAAQWNSDDLGQAIQDIITNLGHLYAQLDEDEWNASGWTDKPTYRSLVENGVGNYDEEVADELYDLNAEADAIWRNR